MTEEIHSCSYYCDRPECIRKQRDEMRENYYVEWARVRREIREQCAKACDARDTGDGTREDQEAIRCAWAIRGLKIG